MSDYLPVCNDVDGTFSVKQCSLSSSLSCWCVDTETGKEIAGTEGENADCSKYYSKFINFNMFSLLGSILLKQLQRCTQNHVKHLRWIPSRKKITSESCFHKKVHLRCFIRFFREMLWRLLRGLFLQLCKVAWKNLESNIFHSISMLSEHLKEWVNQQ